MPSSLPSFLPSVEPSVVPTTIPSVHPSVVPSTMPTLKPSHKPSLIPSSQPSVQPSSLPSSNPSVEPSAFPTTKPSEDPSVVPTTVPTLEPSQLPSLMPSSQPSSSPSFVPSVEPSFVPSTIPSYDPSVFPSLMPSLEPSKPPSLLPSSQPSMQTSFSPSFYPSFIPSLVPSKHPLSSPSTYPSGYPSIVPTTIQSHNPSVAPNLMQSPSDVDAVIMPTTSVSFSVGPVSTCLQENDIVVIEEAVQFALINMATVQAVNTNQPGCPNSRFSRNRELQSSSFSNTIDLLLKVTGLNGIDEGVGAKSFYENVFDTLVEENDAIVNRMSEASVTFNNVSSLAINDAPSDIPSIIPTFALTNNPSSLPTGTPSTTPSALPSQIPSIFPSRVVSNPPSKQHSMTPSLNPSNLPTLKPSSQPTPKRSIRPTVDGGTFHPTKKPTPSPTPNPTAAPSRTPSVTPTTIPSSSPTTAPSSRPSQFPSDHPSVSPTSIPSDHPSLHPSSLPTTVPTSNPSSLPTISQMPTSLPSLDPTTTPTVSPSSQPTSTPSVTPTSNPTSTPSLEPSPSPSEAPSLTPPMTSVHSVDYSRSSNSSESNITQLLEQLSADDANMESILDNNFAACSYYDCRRRYLQQVNVPEGFVPFIVDNVTTYITGNKTCGDPTVNNNTCYDVSTNVTVTRYPVHFSKDRSNLIVVSTVLDYMEDSEIEIVPYVPVPQPVSSQLSITFTGVDPKELEEEEQEIFESTVFEYLDDILGRWEPPILVDSVSFDSQSLSLNVLAKENETSSMSRWLQDSNGDNVLPDNSTVPQITINVTVQGQYLPPPEINFDDVVVEVFDTEEEEEDFIKAIDESNNPYFEPVIEDLDVSVVVIKEVERKNKNNGFFSELGNVGIALISVSSSFVLGIIALLMWQKRRKAKRAKLASQELRACNCI